MGGKILARIERRLTAVGLSAAAASKAAGLSEDAIRNIRRAVTADRKVGVSTRTLEALAPVLGVSVAWLAGDPDERPVVPGDAGGGTIAHPAKNVRLIDCGRYSGGEIDESLVLGQVPPVDGVSISFAIRIRDFSMNLVIPRGAIVYVDTSFGVVKADGIYLVRDDSSGCLLRVFRPDPDRFESLSTFPGYEKVLPASGVVTLGVVRRAVVEF